MLKQKSIPYDRLASAGYEEKKKMKRLIIL